MGVLRGGIRIINTGNGNLLYTICCFNSKGLTVKNTGVLLLSQIYLYQNISGKLRTIFFVMLDFFDESVSVRTLNSLQMY
jgi:hypothetical protein